MPKKYNVGFWYTEYGSVTVEAENAEQAEDLVKEELDVRGTEFSNLFSNHKTNDRDFGAQDATES